MPIEYDRGFLPAFPQLRVTVHAFTSGRSTAEFLALLDTGIEAAVMAMRQAHPGWGKRRIADELAKGNNWVPLVRRRHSRKGPDAASFYPEGTALSGNVNHTRS